MHPEISNFPVATFYNGKVSDGHNVTHENYNKKFSTGMLFGPYSFINVEGGHETTERYGRSWKNTKSCCSCADGAEIVQRLDQPL